MTTKALPRQQSVPQLTWVHHDAGDDKFVCKHVLQEMTDCLIGQKRLVAAERELANQDRTKPDHPYHALYHYVVGFATAINPLPLESPWTFYTNDSEAMHADWMHALSDLDDIVATFGRISASGGDTNVANGRAAPKWRISRHKIRSRESGEQKR